LTESEAKLIRSTEGKFRFDELIVTIKESPRTRMTFPKIKPGKLSITPAHSIAVREIPSYRASDGIEALSVVMTEGKCLLKHFPDKSAEEAQACGEETPEHMLAVWLASAETAISRCLDKAEVIEFQGGVEPPSYPSARVDQITWLTEHIEKLETLIGKIRARSRTR